MVELNAEYAAQLTEHLQGQSAALSESFNQCFDLSLAIGAGTAATWDPTTDSGLQQAGIACLFQLGSVGAALLIPESLMLPEWYRQPNDSQKSRLDTLAMEWGMNLFPPDFEAERTSSVGVDNLASYTTTCQPTTDAAIVRLPVTDADLAELGNLILVWPLTHIDWSPAAMTAATSPSAPEPQPNPSPSLASPQRASRVDPLARLRKLPVTVSVRLTERRITMSQLLAITPGALLTFTKSCDDLLDLYVNNALYCRGEAVKIGESFGLKVNEVGVQVERTSKILES
ncbi:MAG: FliM/FliN family flagellar motor switch protein [Planctomycetaceae bacterium]|nr:FliM/FliN family flagellar motor switch protein [Planctomycetaceae bacterium]